MSVFNASGFQPLMPDIKSRDEDGTYQARLEAGKVPQGLKTNSELLRDTKCVVSVGLLADMLEDVAMWRELAASRERTLSHVSEQLAARTKHLGKLHSRVKGLEEQVRTVEKERDKRYTWADIEKAIESLLPLSIVNAAQGGDPKSHDLVDRSLFLEKLRSDLDCPF